MGNNLTTNQIDKLFKDTFDNEVGLKCLNYLEGVFVDRDIYVPGKSIEETAFRQGEASIIKKIRKALKKRSK